MSRSPLHVRVSSIAVVLNALAIVALCCWLLKECRERKELEIEVGRMNDFCHLVRVELGAIRLQLASGQPHIVEDALQRFYVAGPGHTSRDELLMCIGLEIPWDDYKQCNHDTLCLAELARRWERAIEIPEGH